MQTYLGSGGMPRTHEKAFVDAIAEIECGRFPTRFRELVRHLSHFGATSIRARLLAAVQWGLLTFDTAEDVYQELRRTIGRHWLCETLYDGRG